MTDDIEPHWPDPTPEMLADPLFNAIWQRIKTWDINVPGVYSGYCGATGNHVRAIFDAIRTPEEPHHLTPSERRIMDKALRKSLRPLTPEEPA